MSSLYFSFVAVFDRKVLFGTTQDMKISFGGFSYLIAEKKFMIFEKMPFQSLEEAKLKTASLREKYSDMGKVDKIFMFDYYYNEEYQTYCVTTKILESDIKIPIESNYDFSKLDSLTSITCTRESVLLAPIKTRRVRKPRVGPAPPNHGKRWTEEESQKLTQEVSGKTITVELINEISQAHGRTFSSIQGRLFTKEVITRAESIKLSTELTK